MANVVTSKLYDRISRFEMKIHVGTKMILLNKWCLFFYLNINLLSKKTIANTLITYKIHSETVELYCCLFDFEFL